MALAVSTNGGLDTPSVELGDAARDINMMIVAVVRLGAPHRDRIDGPLRVKGLQPHVFPHIGFLVPVALARHAAIVDHQRGTIRRSTDGFLARTAQPPSPCGTNA